MGLTEISRAVITYAPKLDIEEQLKFSMFIYNKFRDELNLDELNLSYEWREYQKVGA
jgi:hypothetical protein